MQADLASPLKASPLKKYLTEGSKVSAFTASPSKGGKKENSPLKRFGSLRKQQRDTAAD